jgi:hypothetical protein
MKISRLIIALLFCVTYMVAADFIAQPKKKKPSSAQLKELCVREWVAQLGRLADIVELCGKMQRTVLEHTCTSLENDTDNPLHKKDNAALQQCHNKMCAFNETLAELEQQLQEYQSYIETL